MAARISEEADRVAEIIFAGARWPDGVRCAFCETARVIKLTRIGKTGKPVASAYRCNKCHRDFSVMTGTPLHRTHIRLSAWLYILLVYAETPTLKNAHIQTILNITYKAAQSIRLRLPQVAAVFSKIGPLSSRAERQNLALETTVQIRERVPA